MSNGIKTSSTGNIDWSVFLQEGVIVTLTIRRYRGVATIDFSELGIDDDGDENLKDFLDEYIRPGQKRLIPPEIERQLRTIETQARQNLKEKSFDCSAFASSGKFVPKTMYREFKQNNEELSDRFYAVRDAFAKDYDKIIDKVRQDYRVLATRIYMQSHPDAKRASYKFVNSFLDSIVSQIPSSEEIVASFEYKTVLRRIPDYLLNVISKKHDIDERVMRIAASNQPNADPIDNVPLEEQDDYMDDSGIGDAQFIETKHSREQGTTSKHEIIDNDDIEEIDADLLESMIEQSETQASDFVDDVMSKLRKEAYDGAGTVVRSIDKNNGKLVGRASAKAHSLVDELGKMNFYNDIELDERLDALSEALGENSKDRDVQAVRAAALELMEWSGASLDNIREKSAKRKLENDNKRRKKKPVTIKAPKNPRGRRTIKKRA